MVTLEIFDTALYECHISYISYRRYLKNKSQEVSKYSAFTGVKKGLSSCIYILTTIQLPPN